MASVYIVATFPDDSLAFHVGDELHDFFVKHAAQKDEQRRGTAEGHPNNKTQARTALEARYDIDSKSPALIFHSRDLPSIGGGYRYLVVHHANCDQLDFVAEFLAAREATIRTGHGEPMVSIRVRFDDSPLGLAERAKLDAFFAAAKKPGAKAVAPWRPDLVAEFPNQWWFSDGAVGLAFMPIWTDEHVHVHHYLSGDAFASYEFFLCDHRFEKPLRDLESVSACHECGSSELELAQSDDSMPEDQLICAGCGGMFEISVVALHAPVKHLCEERLKSPCADGDALYAISDRGGVWMHAPRWQKIWQDPLPLMALHVRGFRLLVGGRNGIIRLSNDGGKRWHAASCPLTTWVHHFAQSPSGDIYACGDGVVRSRDGGETWTQILDDPGGQVLGVSAPVAGVVFACDRHGRIWRTMNDGKKWRKDHVAHQITICRVVARSAREAVAVGDRGLVASTQNGRRWRMHRTPTNADIEDLVIGNDGRFYALDSIGTILSSANGETWQRHSSGVRDRMWGLAPTPSGALLLVGDNGTAVLVNGIDSKASQ